MTGSTPGTKPGPGSNTRVACHHYSALNPHHPAFDPQSPFNGQEGTHTHTHTLDKVHRHRGETLENS